ncbi:hypothetical protein D9757_012302 [Collybiopsis confluens]|uniref:Protein kinase domain-containing protein n=1 Tax=Collybiopsis confluens TaxID=2823264 RepID=A0A8H5LJ12_9AGAR|nr:hypothetical protein D9757_012302 [Collybiopsis confluens]
MGFLGPKTTSKRSVDNRTAADMLNRALAEWNALRQSQTPRNPDYDWLGTETAQQIVDELQELLDLYESSTSPEAVLLRSKHLGLLRFLSGKFQILPLSLTVQNIQREGGNPVAGGGFADIWRGTLLGKSVCLKVLRIVIEQDVRVRDVIRKEFCHEALIWRQLRHPNILPLLGVNVDLFSPSFCLVSPWMENKDIITYLKQNPTHRIRTVLSEVASGLRYLHSINPPLVHGDIRGANILVTLDHRCCLADFGLSVMTTSSQAWTMRTSLSFTARGTMRWLAPEYLSSDIPNHPSRDVYAFGCTILEVFTQKPPFSDRKNEAAVLLYLSNGGRPQKPQDIWYPDAIWDLTTRCWSHITLERPSIYEICEYLNGLNDHFQDVTSVYTTENFQSFSKFGARVGDMTGNISPTSNPTNLSSISVLNQMEQKKDAKRDKNRDRTGFSSGSFTKLKNAFNFNKTEIPKPAETSSSGPSLDTPERPWHRSSMESLHYFMETYEIPSSSSDSLPATENDSLSNRVSSFGASSSSLALDASKPTLVAKHPVKLALGDSGRSKSASVDSIALICRGKEIAFYEEKLARVIEGITTCFHERVPAISDPYANVERKGLTIRLGCVRAYDVDTWEKELKADMGSRRSLRTQMLLSPSRGFNL